MVYFIFYFIGCYFIFAEYAYYIIQYNCTYHIINKYYMFESILFIKHIYETKNTERKIMQIIDLHLFFIISLKSL